MQVNETTIVLLKRTIENQGWIELPSEGYSMYPFIRRGDVCRFGAFETVRKGEILLFHTAEGRLVAHRYYKKKKDHYFLKGDTNECMDSPVQKGHIIGKLIAIKKKKMIVHMNQFFPKSYGYAVSSTHLTARFFRFLLRRKLGDGSYV
ncbi:S24/S26 family peptidase [Metabacillus indicus]|uniref:S24/S26 family peptidase n=1 Tax=Metabacillus indicus TaxID=246786 RepID=UPI000691A39F|nr:S24/S26 family peptidase [Metabacillus indicus]